MAPSLRAVHLAQQMTGFPVDEMHPGAGLANDWPILAGGRIFVVLINRFAFANALDAMSRGIMGKSAEAQPDRSPDAQ